MLKLKQIIFKLKALYQQHIDNSKYVESSFKAQSIQEMFINNDWVKQSLNEYKADYFKSLT